MDIEKISYTKFRMYLAGSIEQVTKSNFPLRIELRNHEPTYLISKGMYDYLVKQSSNKTADT